MSVVWLSVVSLFPLIQPIKEMLLLETKLPSKTVKL